MDLGTVNVLARIQLGAKRRGLTWRVRHASAGLLELIEFTGLSDALGVEPQRQPEEREDALGVEEERQLGDPPV
jgi:hypothetical protein